jgi:hypothetical protein
MRIEGKNLSVRSDEGDILFDGIDFSFETGEFTILATDDAEKAAAFSMLATGRLRKYGGLLSIVPSHGKERHSILGLREIRGMTAVPFVPKIGEPDDFLKAWRVLQEEFLFAGREVSRAYVLDYMANAMDGENMDLVKAKIKDLKHISRIKMFTELAAMRPNVRFIFVTMPERYGGLPDEWFDKIKDVQTEDNAVILITSKMAAELLRARFGERYYDLDDGMKPCVEVAGEGMMLW